MAVSKTKRSIPTCIGKNDLYIVDAYSQIFRWFYAMPMSFRDAAGNPTNAIFGMTKFLLNLERDIAPKHKIFAFDLGGSVDRKAEHPEYKSNRKEMPEELRIQIPAVRELIEAFGWRCIDAEGYEADDVIATLVRVLPDSRIHIITADKDIAQLVRNPRVDIFLPDSATGSFKLLDEAAVLTRYGVTPVQIPDYLALLGDSADFIPGLAGIGPKYAAMILSEVGSLARFFENPEVLQMQKFRSHMLEERELIERNLRLIYLNDNVPGVEERYKGLEQSAEPDLKRISALIEKYALKSLERDVKKLLKADMTDDLFA